MSTYVSVEISPDTTTRPVFTSVSHATRPVGSSRSTASSTPSEIWSAILSGCPSVTDSEVKRNSLSFSSVMSRNRLVHASETSDGFWRAPPMFRRRALAGTLLSLDEVDDQRDALEAVALAQAVLDEVRVLARQLRPVVDVDLEARRRRADLRHVEHLQPVPLLGGRLALGRDLGEEAVELRGRDPVGGPLGERQRLLQQ